MYTFEELCHWLGLSESVSSSCDSKNLPRARATVGFELQLVDEPIDGKEGTNVSIAEGGWDVKTPYHAAISNAMWLTDHDDGIMDEDNDNHNPYLNNCIIAQVPLANMLGYATIIRSMTQGEGSFSMEFDQFSSPMNEALVKEVLMER